MVVVLPAPLGPKKPMISPGITAKLASRMMAFLPIFLWRFCTCKMGSTCSLSRSGPARQRAVWGGKMDVPLPRCDQYTQSPAGGEGESTQSNNFFIKCSETPLSPTSVENCVENVENWWGGDWVCDHQCGESG